MRNLGIIIDSNLKFHSHSNCYVLKTNHVLSVIAKSFTNLSSDTFPILYKSLVRPVLEYGRVIWGPFYHHDIIQVEKVQRRITCLISPLRHLTYIGRLSALNLPSLTYRHKRHDMLN